MFSEAKLKGAISLHQGQKLIGETRCIWESKHIFALLYGLKVKRMCKKVISALFWYILRDKGYLHSAYYLGIYWSFVRFGLYLKLIDISSVDLLWHLYRVVLLNQRRHSFLLFVKSVGIGRNSFNSKLPENEREPEMREAFPRQSAAFKIQRTMCHNDMVSSVEGMLLYVYFWFENYVIRVSFLDEGEVQVNFPVKLTCRVI